LSASAWQDLANREQIAGEFLARFVDAGPLRWRGAVLDADQRALCDSLPRVQAALRELGDRDDPDALPEAIEAAVVQAVEALQNPFRSAAQRHLGLTDGSRGKTKGDREDLAARQLRRRARWYRTPSPTEFDGATPGEWILAKVAAQLAADPSEAAVPPSPSADAQEADEWTERFQMPAPRLAPASPGTIELPAGGVAVPKPGGERLLDWEQFFAVVDELGRRVFADRAYGGFWPDAVVGVNHGGAIVAGLLYYAHSRTFEIFTLTARADDFVSSPSHLTALVELAERCGRPIRVLLVDDSMKTGDSLLLARTVVEAALAGFDATIRVAVLVYRPDYHEQAGTTAPGPELYVRTDVDSFPYGPV
jgi:hypoxanthine phosphoribosyltransferase